MIIMHITTTHFLSCQTIIFKVASPRPSLFPFSLDDMLALHRCKNIQQTGLDLSYPS
jgi:hypothetical protein